MKGKPGEKGNSADYEYHLLGMKLKQTTTVLDVHKPHGIVYEMFGGIPGRHILWSHMRVAL